MVVLGCARNADPPGAEPNRDSVAAPCGAVQTLAGHINVIVGDPPRGSGGTATRIVELARASAPAVPLVADSASATALDDASRLVGTAVRVTGRFACGDSTTFRVTRIESVAEERR
jgi:hypothetical protein